MNRYFYWSRHHACTDGPISLILFFKCSLKSKGESHGERNSKNCLENSKKTLKRHIIGPSCSVNKIIDNNSARWG